MRTASWIRLRSGSRRTGLRVVRPEWRPGGERPGSCGEAVDLASGSGEGGGHLGDVSLGAPVIEGGSSLLGFGGDELRPCVA